jgi:hypothetical protein
VLIGAGAAASNSPRDIGKEGISMRAFFVFIAAIVLGMTAAQARQCPLGSYPWTDSWGNSICKRFDGGGTATIRGSLTNCPTGSFPSVDTWGNRTCKTFRGGVQYYDASRRCPIGTYRWADTWGNPICRRF